jgi:antitoxin VapB
MNIITTKPFRSGNSEAIRLPKHMAFGPDTEVVISKHGDIVTIRPKPKQSIKEMIARMNAIGAPEDGVQAREPFEAPERPGL